MGTQNLGEDLLWGVEAISRELGRDERQTYHLLAKGDLPGARKVGGRWVVSRSWLRTFFAGSEPGSPAVA